VLIILPCLLLLLSGAAAGPGQVLKSITHFLAYGFLIKRINQDLAGETVKAVERQLRNPFSPISSFHLAKRARSTLKIQNALNEA